MQGEIWVESSAGVGSTFSFTASFGLGEDTGEANGLLAEQIRDISVLIVDDSEASLEILSGIASNLGFISDVANSGTEALNKLHSAVEAGNPFQLAFVDWKMPGMDGLELTRQIQGTQRVSPAPKVVLITAYDREEALHEAGDINIESYLTKPISASTMLEAASAALGNSTRSERHDDSLRLDTGITAGHSRRAPAIG